MSGFGLIRKNAGMLSLEEVKPEDETWQGKNAPPDQRSGRKGPPPLLFSYRFTSHNR